LVWIIAGGLIWKIINFCESLRDEMIIRLWFRVFFSVLLFILIDGSFLAGVEGNDITLKGLKFFKQRKLEWCGPAIMQTVLNYYGIKESQEEIARRIWNPEEKVVKLSEMVYYPREKGLKSYSFEGSAEIIRELLSQGIPVIVFQRASKKVNKGHYRIVTGYKGDELIFYDPLLGKKVKSKAEEFTELWEFGGEKHWGLIVVRDDDSLDDNLKDNEIYYRDMARALLRRKKFEQSRWFWEKALEKARRASYLYGMAFTHLQEGNLKLAENFATEAINIEPDNPFCYDVMAEIEYKRGNYEKALDLIHKARKLSDDEYFKRKYETWLIKYKEGRK